MSHDRLGSLWFLSSPFSRDGPHSTAIDWSAIENDWNARSRFSSFSLASPVNGRWRRWFPSLSGGAAGTPRRRLFRSTPTSPASTGNCQSRSGSIPRIVNVSIKVKHPAVEHQASVRKERAIFVRFPFLRLPCGFVAVPFFSNCIFSARTLF